MNKKRIIWFGLMVIVMTVIFIFSNQGGEQSHAISNALAETVNIHPIDEQTDASITPIVFGFNLRNIAHIGLYAVLGFVTLMWTYSWKKTVMIGYGYACLDEIHQLFVDSRGANITDTFLDAFGVAIVIVIWLIQTRLKHKKCNCN